MNDISISWIWVILWFVIGLIVFKAPSSKGIFSSISNLAMIPIIFASVYTIPTEVTNEILTSITCTFSYLIGANISRNQHMKIGITPNLVFRLIKYGIVLIIIYLIFG